MELQKLSEKLLHISGLDNIILYEDNMYVPIKATPVLSCLDCDFFTYEPSGCIFRNKKDLTEPCNKHLNTLGIGLIFKKINIDTDKLPNNIDIFTIKKI